VHGDQVPNVQRNVVAVPQEAGPVVAQQDSGTLTRFDVRAGAKRTRLPASLGARCVVAEPVTLRAPNRDPFRRNEREKKSAGDDGDLFGLRPRARKLRVLLDIDSLKEPTTYEEHQTAGILLRLLDYDLVRVWRIDMSKVNQAENENEHDDGTVYLHSNAPDGMGPYGKPGPSYSLRVVTDAKNAAYTSISPVWEILKDIKDHCGCPMWISFGARCTCTATR
jgi:hypothetical protein